MSLDVTCRECGQQDNVLNVLDAYRIGWAGPLGGNGLCPRCRLSQPFRLRGRMVTCSEGQRWLDSCHRHDGEVVYARLHGGVGWVQGSRIGWRW